MRHRHVWFLIAGVLLTALAAMAAAPQDAVAPPPRSILFIGDSLTYSQNGIYFHLEKMAASAKPPLTIKAEKAVVPGASLKMLWERATEPRQFIAQGAYEVVVIQEDLPETDIPSFRDYARRFVAEVDRPQSRPVLLMAWAYRRLGWISMAEIAQAHRDVSLELGVDVAPVGLAWERAMKERPDIDLFVADREHPSIYGTYLATAVVYTTVFDKDPSALTYLPPGVTAEVGAFLRRVAWQTCQEYRRL